MSRGRPVWQQALVTATLVALACSIAMLAGTARSPSLANVGVWALILAAPLALFATIVAWRRGRRQRWIFPLVSVLAFCAAGLLARGFSSERWPAAIPILNLAPLLYPVAGLVWGALLRQLWEQGYLAFLGLEAPE